MIRQGDLLFVRAAVPAKATPAALVVAEGEVTGHAHRVREGTGAVLALMADVRRLFVRAGQAGALVDHEEHGTVILEEGEWEIIRQREYEPSGWRQVQD